MSEIATILKLLSDVCLAAAAIGCLYLLTASAMVLRYRRGDVAAARRDLLSFAAFIGGFLGDSVRWRAASYHIIGDGRLSPGRTQA